MTGFSGVEQIPVIKELIKSNSRQIYELSNLTATNENVRMLHEVICVLTICLNIQYTGWGTS